MRDVVAGAPAAPGVYLLLGEGAELRYVGKATDLGKRLGDHARSARWKAVREVRWVECKDEDEALCLEADLVFATRPPGNAAMTLDELTYLCVDGDRFLLVAQPHGRAYGGFPHLGKGKASWPAVRQKAGYAALLRLLWAACADDADPPARLRGDSPPAEHRAPVRDDLVEPLHGLLSGRSAGLLRRLDETIENAPVIQRRGLTADIASAKLFYRLGPQRMRTLRLRHGARAPIDEPAFRRMVLADLHEAVGEVTIVPRDPAAAIARGRTARSLERRR